MVEKATGGKAGKAGRGASRAAYSLVDRRDATAVHRRVISRLEELAGEALAVLSAGMAAKGGRLTRAQAQEWGVRMRSAEAVLERLRLLVGSVGTVPKTSSARSARIEAEDAEAEPDDEAAIQELRRSLS